MQIDYHKALFTSGNQHWQTPDDLYASLDSEFHFTLDPCPNGAIDGLTRSWTGQRVYCNPPYGRQVRDWLRKGEEAELAVYLLPSRTDTRWWHEFATKANEIRFLRGRLKFKGAKQGAPFSSVILVFRRKESND